MAHAWVHAYYNSFVNKLDKLTDYATNPNIALVSGFMCAETDEQAIRSSLEIFAREVMPEFHDREPAHQEWKKAVLSGDLVLYELSTTEHSYRRATLREDASSRPAE